MTEIVTCSRCHRNYAIGKNALLHSCLGPPGELVLLANELEDALRDQWEKGASVSEVSLRVNEVARRLRKIAVG